MATAFDIINQGFANDTAANQQASQMKLQYALENFQMAKQQEAAIAAEGRAYTRQMDVISKQAQINAESQRKSFEQQAAMQAARDKAMDERQDSKEAAASKKAEEEARRKSKAAAGGVRAIKSQIEQMQANLQGEFSTLDQRSRTPDIAATATQQLLASGRIKPDQAVVLKSHIEKATPDAYAKYAAAAKAAGKQPVSYDEFSGSAMDAYEQALANFAKSNETSMWRGSAKEGSEIASTLSAYENLKQQRKAQLALQADNNFQLAKASIDDLYRQAAEVERYILPEDRDVLTPKTEADPNGKGEGDGTKPQAPENPPQVSGDAQGYLSTKPTPSAAAQANFSPDSLEAKLAAERETERKAQLSAEAARNWPDIALAAKDASMDDATIERLINTPIVNYYGGGRGYSTPERTTRQPTVAEKTAALLRYRKKAEQAKRSVLDNAERIRAFKPANKTQEEELARALSLMSPSGE